MEEPHIALFHPLPSFSRDLCSRATSRYRGLTYSDPFGLAACETEDILCQAVEGFISITQGFALGHLFETITMAGVGGASEGVQTGGAAIAEASVAGPSVATAAVRGAVLDGAAAAGKGGFQLGTMTAGDFSKAATAFAGEGATLSGSGRALVSADATYVARFPLSKTYGTPFNKISGNLIIKNGAGQEVVNAHVPILFGPGH